MAQVDLVLFNGRIWTAHEGRPWASALAVSGKQVVALGEDAEIRSLASSTPQSLDLDGRLVVPGLWDSHIHLYHWSLSLQAVVLEGCASLEEMLDRIATHEALADSGGWLVGWGWNETLWGGSPLPTRWDLDRLTGPRRPAIFWRSDMHSAVANTAALAAADLLEEVPAVEGGVVEVGEDGTPTGILRELAINRVRSCMPEPSAPELEGALVEATRRLHRVGVTGVCDQRMKDQDEGPLVSNALARLNRRGLLKLRVSCNVAAHHLPHLESLGLSWGLGDDRLRLGHVKVFADGTLGSRTAWMLEPFERAGGEAGNNTGLCLTPPSQITVDLARCARLGFPLSIHAIGDRALRSCLDIFEEAGRQGLETPPVPHRLEHVQILADGDLPRLAALGIVASMQPGHLLDDMDTADRFLGERARRAYRLGGLLRSGALLAFGSDAPVCRIDPFYGVHAAVVRQRPERRGSPPWFPEERLTVEETLRGYTIGAATAAGWEDVTGSLAPGKRADLAVLDRDLFALEERGLQGDELAATRVLLTLFDGEVVHREGI